MRGWESVTPFEIAAKQAHGGASLPRRSTIARPVGPSRPSKYRAVKTALDGFLFSSKAEALRYLYLLARGQRGELSNLELQPSFPLVVNGVKVAVYFADFCYDEQGVHVVEDVKGMKGGTAVFRLKKRIVEAQYGIKVQEIR